MQTFVPAFVFSYLFFFSYLLLGAQESEGQGSILGPENEQAKSHVKKWLRKIFPIWSFYQVQVRWLFRSHYFACLHP